MLPRLFRVFVAVAVLLSTCFAAQAKAQETDFDFVVSISSLNDLQSGLTNAASKIDPSSAGMVQMLMMTMPIPVGMDADKPFGLVGTVGDGLGETGFFGTVKDEDSFKAWYDTAIEKEQLPKDAKLTLNGDVFVLLPENSKLVLPEQPAKLLGDLPSKYVVAAKVKPVKFVDLGVGLAGMLGAEDLDSQETQDSVEETRKMLADINSYTLGLNINEQGDLILDMKSDVKAGSELDKQLVKCEASVKKAMLMGFCDENADASFYSIGVLNEVVLQAIEQALKTAVEDGELDEEMRTVLKEAFSGDNVEVAGSLNFTAEGKFTALLACKVKDGRVIEKLIREDKDDNWDVQLDADKVGKSITIHTGVDKEDGAKIAIGIHKQFMFLSISDTTASIDEDVKTLKATINKTMSAKAPKSITQAQLNTSLFKLAPKTVDLGELKGAVTWKTTLDGKTSTLSISNDFIKGLAKLFAASAAEDGEAPSTDEGSYEMEENGYGE